MGELHTLPGVVAAAGTPQPNVIERLEGLLELAKSGEIQAFAYAAVDRENASSNGWSGDHDMMSAIAFLFHRYGRDCLRADFEPINDEGGV